MSSTPELQIHATLDARGTEVALLWTRVRLQLERIEFDGRLAVLVDDPAAILDLPARAVAAGHLLVEVRGEAWHTVVVIQRRRQNFAAAFMGR